MSDKSYVGGDLNVLNFERVKWGGIRLNHLLYCMLDLELLSREEEFSVSREDLAILERMVAAVESCGPDNTARKLEKRWRDLLPANQHERDVIMEIWGYAGILVPQEEPRKGRGRVAIITPLPTDYFCFNKLSIVSITSSGWS